MSIWGNVPAYFGGVALISTLIAYEATEGKAVRQLTFTDSVGSVPLQNATTALTCRFRLADQAARWYSLITPPSTFRRSTGTSSGTTTGLSSSGGRCCRD